jgi:hypothetical protein
MYLKNKKEIIIELGRWYIPVIPVLRRLRQKDSRLKANLGYIARPCLKRKICPKK